MGKIRVARPMTVEVDAQLQARLDVIQRTIKGTSFVLDHALNLKRSDADELITLVAFVADRLNDLDEELEPLVVALSPTPVDGTAVA